MSFGTCEVVLGTRQESQFTVGSYHCRTLVSIRLASGLDLLCGYQQFLEPLSPSLPRLLKPPEAAHRHQIDTVRNAVGHGQAPAQSNSNVVQLSIELREVPGL